MPDGATIRYESPPTDGADAQLADAVRRLMDAVVLTTAPDAELRDTTASLNLLLEQLEGPGGSRLRSGTPWPPVEKMGRGDRAHNPVAGPANPLAPPLSIAVDADGSVRSEVTMRPIHEGPPGGAHGGWVAALLDQLLGAANIAYGVGAMTAELTIRYRRPTPIGVPLTLRARTDSIDERRVHASGEIVADGVVTAEARGLFIRPTPERLERHKKIASGRTQPRG
jgi:acyl-coenzyme A thioesterase PaaI-like protein